ncbi:hypothetical protein MBGDC06_00100 [Thermoplasmatales archaeon SCGC AB-539-C06]|nr:hypothetical protein MBGDC06_00100 [Thermoplasmatales archaeon SCGC AB-539-C06]
MELNYGKMQLTKGKIQPNEPGVWADSQRGLGNFTTKELKDYASKAHKSFYLNPSLWARELHFAFTKKNFQYIRAGLRMFLEQ